MITDKQLRQIVRGFTRGLLGGDTNQNKCWIVCLPLQGYLSICGCETEVIEGEVYLNGEPFHHYWLELQDGRIIDPTASQFNEVENKEMPPIYIGEKPEWYQYYRSILRD